MDPDFPVGDGAAQLVFQGKALANGNPDFVAEVRDLVFAVAFGRVHGAVGLLQQVFILAVRVGKDADADAGPDGDFVALDVEGIE